MVTWIQNNGPKIPLAMLAFVALAPASAAQEAVPPIVAVNQPAISTDDSNIARGGALMDQGKYDEAIRLFDAILQRSPKNGHALANRALAYGWTNRLEEAERDLRSAAWHGRSA